MWKGPLETQLPTCQHLVVGLPAMGHLSMGEHFPHQHTKGPNIRLGGEVTLQDGLGGHPSQRHPSLAEVVVLAAGENHTWGWGQASAAHRVGWVVVRDTGLSSQVWVSSLIPGLGLVTNFSTSRHSRNW